MKVLHVSKGLCPRIVKLAWVQQKNDIQTIWVGETPPSYQKTYPFSSMSIAAELRFGGLDQAIGKVKADIIHVHTHKTDMRIMEAVQRVAKCPVIWDCHDEPFGGMLALKRLAPVDYLAGPQGVVYRTYCPKDWFPETSTPSQDLIISTGLSDVKGHFRYWLDVFSQIRTLGIGLKCYTFSEIPQEYRDVADMMAPIDVQELLKEMSSATAGLCGSPFPDENMKHARPNKLYEYIAAGIPVICFGKDHEMASEILEKKLGVVVSSASEIPDAIRYIKNNGIREHVQKIRGEFSMESEWPKVYEKYRIESLSFLIAKAMS